MKRILFLVPYPESQAPSQRFRFEQYFSHLIENEIRFDIHPFLDAHTWSILYKPGRSLRKISGILRGFARRIGLLFSLAQYDFVFIHRETAPLGPPFFEWVIAKIFRKKILYDFDDAIWLANTSEVNSLAAKVKWHGKVASICKWSYKVSCGNAYLCEYANRFNKNVILNPTTIDTVNLHSPILFGKKENPKTIVGWTGTHSTLQYLKDIVPVLARLQKELDFEIQVISNQEPGLGLNNLIFVPWNKKTEIEDLSKFDIGIMPLTDDKWSKGKCGFKALQYMSLEIPAVISPVGVNTRIVENGVNGFLCTTPEDWYQSLKTLIENIELRKKIGKNGRQKVINEYSVISNKDYFLSLFE